MENKPPMMGWSTWNQFRQNINEELVMDVAESMKRAGLLEAGYRYLNLDDCWQASNRDIKGRLCFDVGRFPSRQGLVERINKMGFKVGLYSSASALTCEDMPGSYGFEEIDANTFVDWGVEYLKYDYCHVVDLPTDPHFEKKNFANETPPILYIGVTPLDGSLAEIIIPAEEAELFEPAELEEGAVVKLNCPKAAAVFRVEAPKNGEYQIAVGYKKRKSAYRQFMLIAVNGEAAQVWFPPTSGWSSTARATVNVTLSEGENLLLMTNPIREQKDDTVLRYRRMGEALKKASVGRPIAFSICEHGRTKPWTWASEFGSSWRVCSDIHANWRSIMNNYEAAADLWKEQKPGAYNDPDMLEIGVAELTEAECVSHFALWCMMSAPLVLGMDVREISEEMLRVVTNRELININQDGLMLQASRVNIMDGLDLLLKPLADGSAAMCLFNKSDYHMMNVQIKVGDIAQHDKRVKLVKNSIVLARDILAASNDDWVELDGIMTIGSIQTHGVVVYILKGQ